jgi:hydroxymethylglutaryl-CoA lyase
MLNSARHAVRRFSTSLGATLADYLPTKPPFFWNPAQYEILKRWPVTPEMLPRRIHVVEVGPRDGLQYESESWSVDERVKLVEALSSTGLRDIEVGALVSAKRVPQMAGSDKVFTSLRREKRVGHHLLVPNQKAMEQAIKIGATHASIFVSPSEHFSRKNINRTVEESLNDAQAVCDMAHSAGISVRGYVSCITHSPDPNEKISPYQVVDVGLRLLDMGCYQVSLGDTLGKATPPEVARLLCAFPFNARRFLAGHFHDTNGNGAANVVAAMHLGVRVFDTSIAGLGGCPFAGSATGNLDTRKLLFVCSALGVRHRVNEKAILKLSDRVLEQVTQKRNQSKDTCLSR